MFFSPAASRPTAAIHVGLEEITGPQHDKHDTAHRQVLRAVLPLGQLPWQGAHVFVDFSQWGMRGGETDRHMSVLCACMLVPAIVDRVVGWGELKVKDNFGRQDTLFY